MIRIEGRFLVWMGKRKNRRRVSYDSNNDGVYEKNSGRYGNPF